MRSSIALFILIAVLLPGLSAMSCQQPMRAAQPVWAASETLATGPDTGTLVAIGEMGGARAAHTATTLLDGRVLIAGGIRAAPKAPGSAELFDPATSTFTLASPMLTPRQSHTATTLADGKVLITGGYDAENEYLASAEVYDPVTETFAAGGMMQSARAGHVALRLQDGRVLVIGGVGTGWTFLASAEVYDPVTGTFTSTGSMRFARESHVAVELEDGRVLVIGGHRGRRSNIELYTSIEVYDPATGSFGIAGDMTVRRHKHDAVLLPSGQVLITGGTDERDYRGRYASAELFDPNTATTALIEPMHRPRYKHAGTSIVLPGGRVLLAGGTTQAEVFDPETRTFHLVGGEARMVGQFSATALLTSGRVLVTGGYGAGRGAQASAWVYHP